MAFFFLPGRLSAKRIFLSSLFKLPLMWLSASLEFLVLGWFFFPLPLLLFSSSLSSKFCFFLSPPLFHSFGCFRRLDLGNPIASGRNAFTPVNGIGMGRINGCYVVAV
ncbi:hypothetical protein GGI35DRAFT_421457 [Trichoderma velutinum]